MKFVIFGATGFIGKRLVSALLSGGYEILVVTRNVDKAREVLGNDVEYHTWDDGKVEGLGKIMIDANAIINLAGESIASKAWTEKQKRKIIDSRVSLTATIVDAINQMEKKPNVLLQASAIGYYGSDPDKTFDENSPRGDGFLADVTVEWEAATKHLDSKVRLVLLRTGLVIGPGGGVLEPIAQPFKFGVGGHIGSGKQWFSWIHIEDEVKAIIYLFENNELNGPFNLTAPEPVTMKTFAKELGHTLKKPSWFHAPAAAIKLFMGQRGKEMLLSGQKVIPKRLIESGFKFQFSEVRMALTNILNF
jgi:uncharacterized protein (TIGR01777 family)